MIFNNLQRTILEYLDNEKSLDELVKLDGFTKEIKYLEDENLIECTERPRSNEPYYSCYNITSFGRRTLSN